MKLQLKLHIQDMQRKHDSFSCRDSGLMISSSHPFLAATPDGIVDCTCCGMGILEIKCPYCIRQDDPGTAPCFEGDSYNYCYCKEECGGEMVGCDNPRCQAGEWFHLSCLRLKKKSHYALNGIAPTAENYLSFPEKDLNN